MDHFYNKLMAIAMLLLITMISFADSQSNFCGRKGPSFSGPCKHDYFKCVTKVMDALIEKTPKAKTKPQPRIFRTSWPHGQPSGSVKGYAICEYTSSVDECESCLNRAKEWLAYNCAESDIGVYSQADCGISYSQVA
ncbi:hypothetical protein LINPERHAP2_LOCUS10668 [Linum perenne]